MGTVEELHLDKLKPIAWDLFLEIRFPYCQSIFENKFATLK
jgi:hypothetical protein